MNGPRSKDNHSDKFVKGKHENQDSHHKYRNRDSDNRDGEKERNDGYQDKKRNTGEETHPWSYGENVGGLMDVLFHERIEEESKNRQKKDFQKYVAKDKFHGICPEILSFFFIEGASLCELLCSRNYTL